MKRFPHQPERSGIWRADGVQPGLFAETNTGQTRPIVHGGMGRTDVAAYESGVVIMWSGMKE